MASHVARVVHDSTYVVHAAGAFLFLVSVQLLPPHWLSYMLTPVQSALLKLHDFVLFRLFLISA